MAATVQEKLSSLEENRLAFHAKHENWYMKVLRTDESCFIRSFLNGFSAHSRALRMGARKKYIVKDGTIFYRDRRSNKLYHVNEDGTPNFERERAPRYTKLQKAGFSKPQPTTLFSINTPEPNPFRPDGWANEGFIGVAFPQDATLPHQSYSLLDISTVLRPSERNSFEDAKDFLEIMCNKIIFTEVAAFKEALRNWGDSATTHNEPSMRVKWTPECCVFIFSDDLSSRLVAEHLACEITKKFGVEKPPVYFYIKGHPKHYTQYTEQELEADRITANTIASNKKERDALLDNNRFKWLLGVEPNQLRKILNSPPNRDTFLEKNLSYASFWKKRIVGNLENLWVLTGDAYPHTRLIDLYMKGHVFYANALAERAGINFKEHLNTFSWENVHTIHSSTVLDLALHYPELYIRLPMRAVEDEHGIVKNLEESISLGCVQEVAALLRHPQAQMNNEFNLLLAIDMNRLDIVDVLLDAAYNGLISGRTPISERLPCQEALLVAETNGDKEIAQRLLTHILKTHTYMTEQERLQKDKSRALGEDDWYLAHESYQPNPGVSF